MPLASDSIPNLLNGISQQPASLRLRTQGEVQNNAYSSLVEGLKKRAPMEHIAKLTTSDLSSSFVHTINRDLSERYEAFFGDMGVEVFDLATGAAQTVNYSDYVYKVFDAVAATETSAGRRYYIPTGVTTINLATVGLDTSDVVVWEKSTTGDFAGEETTVRTDTADADATVSWTSGDYLRADYTRVTSTDVDVIVTYKSIDYLVAAAQTSLRAITVADFTFLVNNTIAVAMSNLTDPAQKPQGLIYIKQAVQDRKYEVFIDGNKEATTTPTDAASTDTSDIAVSLKTSLDTNIGADFDMTRAGNVITIERTDGAEFTMRVTDGFGDLASSGVKDTIQKFTDLPKKGKDGFKVKVVGDETTEFDDYYVVYVDNGETSTGVWEETFAPGLVNAYDENTMPHTLVREANGDFTFGAATWSTRVAGDADSAPPASFVGRKINDVFFVENRLGFLADENAIMSEFSEFFNFWPTTVTALLDTDRIDISGAHSKIAILRHAVAYSEQLIVFSEETQFILDAGDVLSPRTAKLKPTTEFKASKSASPIGAGKNVYFVNELGDFTRVREYFVSATLDTKDAADITSHVPSYIPKNVFKIAGATHDDVLFFLSSDTQNIVYIYKFFWAGEGGAEKLQSSWARWIFDSADNILNVDVIDENVILAIQRADGVYLEKINLQPQRSDAGLGYLVHLDRRTELTGSYDSGTDLTTWTLPYADTAKFTVVLGANFGDETGDAPAVLHPTSTTLTAPGDFSAGTCFVGRDYTFTYQFSELVVREQSGSGEAAIKGGTLKIKNILVVYENTGFFIATVAPAFRASYSYKFTGNIIGQAVIGETNILDGVFRIPVQGKAEEVVVTLVNDSHLPCAFLSAEWAGWFTQRARRL